MICIYRLALAFLIFLFAPVLLWRLFRRPSYRVGILQKFGVGYPQVEKDSIWVHAVSVGEVIASLPLIRELQKAGEKRIVLSVTTPTGFEVATKKLPDNVVLVHFPFDLFFATKPAVRAIRPKLFITIDTEIWPDLFSRLKAGGSKISILNGRISDRSYKGYKRFSFFFKTVLANVDLFLMQSEEDKNRIVSIGADSDKVFVGGNLKFEGVMGSNISNPAKDILALLENCNRPVFLLGSLHQGEEEAIKACSDLIRTKGGTIIIAPRRIKECGWIESELSKSGMNMLKRTALKSDTTHELPPDTALVIDSFGELSSLYQLADIVFVGGSLIDHGGQNPLEAASFGKPVLFGPFMSNFREAEKELLKIGGAISVAGGAELKKELLKLCDDEEKQKMIGSAGIKLVQNSKGVAKKMAEKVMALT